MNLKDTLFKYILVIVLAVLIFWIDGVEGISNDTTKVFLFIFCLLKLGFFFYHNFKKLLEASKNDTPYYQFLLFLSLNIVLIIVSYGIDFYCLWRTDPKSFSGLGHHETGMENFAEFVFFSIFGFTNFGYGYIIAESILAKFMLTSELLLSYTYIIFILSDFMSLKESIANSSLLKSKKSEEDN